MTEGSITTSIAGNGTGAIVDLGATIVNGGGQSLRLDYDNDGSYVNIDEFRFAFKQLSGNGTIEAQVLSVQNTHEWAKAGVMIRESLDSTSRFTGVYITPSRGCRFQLRDATGYRSDTDVTTLAHIRAPHWVKLERIEDTLNAYVCGGAGQRRTSCGGETHGSQCGNVWDLAGVGYRPC